MIKIGLASHLVNEYNLGCSALAISNIRLLDEVFLEKGIQPYYIVLLDEPKKKMVLEEYISLERYTDNPYTYKTYPRLKPILINPFLLSRTEAFDDCDFIFNLCGGDGYSDIYGFIKLLAQSVVVYGASIKKKPVIFAPQTIGPFSTFWGKMIARHVLNKLEWLFARDISSFQCCENLNLSSKTTQAIDVAFALPYKKKEFKGSKFRIGINVSGLLYNGGFNRDNYFNLSFSYKDFIVKLISRLLKNNSYEIHLIGHVLYETEDIDDDYGVCEKLKRKNQYCILAPRFVSAPEAKGYIAGMDLLIGARMHATIAAFSSGVPVIPVAYSRKFNGLYSTLNYPYLIDAKSGISCDEALMRFDEYMTSIDAMSENIKSSVAIYKQEIEKYKFKLIELMDL